MSDLRIVSWNCRNTFGYGLTEEKAKSLSGYFDDTNWPDILVIQELTCEEAKRFSDGHLSYKWYGDGKNGEKAGVAVFTRNAYNIEEVRISEFGKMLRYVIPYRITGPRNFNLYAVWTKGDPFGYTETVLLSLLEYKPKDPTILIGDFNTGRVSDQDVQYTTLADALKQKGFINCDTNSVMYPTSHWHGKSYQNDFCFASGFSLKSSTVSADDSDWNQNESRRGLSDHCPIIVDFYFP